MVQWLKNQPNESLLNYTQRIIDAYNISSEDIIVGLSFGGLIAQQIAEILNLDYVILISSFRTKDDLNTLFNKGLKFKLHKLMPEVKSKIISEIVANFLNSGTAKSKPVLKKMIESTDMKLMKWSLEKIFEQNKELCPNVIKYNLIGNKDMIMKPWQNETSFLIEGGSHFMVFDKANEITEIISEIVRWHHNT